MPEHDPKNNDLLNSRGANWWSFGFEFKLPATPEDGRDWWSAQWTIDNELEATKSYEAGGVSLIRKDSILFFMYAYGRYSTALELASKQVNHALAAGSLSTSQLAEIHFIDPTIPLSEEPPF